MTFESVPKNHDGLELFIRTINAYSFTSDATVLFVPPKPEFRIKTGGKNGKSDSFFGGGQALNADRAIHKSYSIIYGIGP